MTSKYSPEYSSWKGMKQRCLNLNSPFYSYYGGRGIVIDESWINSFANFLADMGNRPEGFELDRINNNGNYCKENCKWSSRSENQRNRRAYGKYLKGVSYSKDKRFLAQIIIEGVKYHIGSSDTEREAGDAYKLIYKEWYGKDYEELK